MAKSKIRLPRLHVKTAILAALILFLPLVVLVASSKQLQDTRSSAFMPTGDGGGSKMGPEQFQVAVTLDTKRNQVRLAWIDQKAARYSILYNRCYESETPILKLGETKTTHFEAPFKDGDKYYFAFTVIAHKNNGYTKYGYGNTNPNFCN